MDTHGNMIAVEGCTRCICGAKYWEFDICHSCGKSLFLPFQDMEQVDHVLFTNLQKGSENVTISEIMKAVYV